MQIHNLLITAESLADAMPSPALRVIDCRFNLLQPEAGRQRYLEAHIPGAVYAHLDDDLAAPVAAHTGRHPLPDPETLASFLGDNGIGAETQVVVYDDNSGAIAARAWWLLRWLGHERVAVLDGGLGAWRALRLPLEAGAISVAPAEFASAPRPEMIIETDEIVAGLDGVLVDAREAARFRGEQEPIDAVAGHIPGALNLPCSMNTREDGTWKSPAELRHAWSETLPDGLDATFGVMCGSGVTACHLVLSSLLAGINEPRVYIGSWSEWIRDPGRPIAKGDI